MDDYGGDSSSDVGCVSWLGSKLSVIQKRLREVGLHSGIFWSVYLGSGGGIFPSVVLVFA